MQPPGVPSPTAPHRQPLRNLASTSATIDSLSVWGVTPIYAASEAPIEGVTGEALAARIRDFGHRNAHYVDSTDQGVTALAETAQAGDAVMTLGAGNIWQAGDALLARLGSKN